MFYLQWSANVVMTWYLIPDQVLIHHRDLKKTNKEDDNDLYIEDIMTDS
jgi:hypothetical protein